MNKHVMITGGSGFLGRELCRQLSNAGVLVFSLSRHGKPDGIKDDDYQTVNWIKGDVLTPTSWEACLDNCKGIIHCVGILHEEPEKGITYERMILEAAKTVGKLAKDHQIDHLVYISGGAAAPGTPAGYMKNKEAAESFLEKLGLKLTILKPAMLYGSDKPETIAENDEIQKMLDDPHIRIHLYPNRPLPVGSVAAVAIQALMNDNIPDKLSVDDIEKMAQSLNHE